MKKRLVATILLCLLGDCLARADLVAFSYDDYSIYRLSTATLEATKIGTLGIAKGGTDLACLAKASETTAYIVDRAADILYTISLVDASTVSSVQLDQNMEVNGRGLAVSPTGTLYGVLLSSKLRTIDPVTGSTALATDISTASIESITFSADGTLYAAEAHNGYPQLSTLDVSTGQLEHVADLGSLDADSITFADDGYIYAADSQAGMIADLYRINPTSGTVINLGSTGVMELNGLLSIASDPAVVPVPGAAILGILGLGMAGYRLRLQM